jgi:hypothetical protein
VVDAFISMLLKLKYVNLGFACLATKDAVNASYALSVFMTYTGMLIHPLYQLIK